MHLGNGLQIMQKSKVIHVLPGMNIGGVEVGIQRSFRELNTKISYEIFSIRGAGNIPIPTIGWISLFKCCINSSSRPDVVVSSLWYGHILGGIVAILCGAKWVPFFHSASSKGIIRSAVLFISCYLCKNAFFDSEATYDYFKDYVTGNYKIIPYRFQSSQSNWDINTLFKYDCIFVGRISPVKRIDLLLNFIQIMQSLRFNLKVIVVLSGSEQDEINFKKQVESNNLQIDIKFNQSQVEVEKLLYCSKLYLSFSDYEGFSMSTVDAISYGCIPVVRPVGQIGKYVTDDGGIIISDTSQNGLLDVALKCQSLLNNETLMQNMSDVSIGNINQFSFYVDAFLDGIDILINK